MAEIIPFAAINTAGTCPGNAGKGKMIKHHFTRIIFLIHTRFQNGVFVSSYFGTGIKNDL